MNEYGISPHLMAAVAPSAADLEWMDQAACGREDPALFFGGEGESFHAHLVREEKAKAVCRGCPVADSCLKRARDRGEPWGIWGGVVFENGRPRRRIPGLCTSNQHVMNEENTYIRPGTTWVYCKECRRIADRAALADLKETA